MFPLTAVTDPKFVLFKHIVFCPNNVDSLPECMSTNCPHWGAAAPPLPPRPVRQNSNIVAIGRNLFYLTERYGHYFCREKAQPVSLSRERHTCQFCKERLETGLHFENATYLVFIYSEEVNR